MCAKVTCLHRILVFLLLVAAPLNSWSAEEDELPETVRLETFFAHLAEVQEEDGFWADRSEGAEVPPRRIHATALMVLAYYGAGYDHSTPNRYREATRMGIHALVSAQNDDGRFSDRVAIQAVVTMALCEGYAMSNDQSLRSHAQKSVTALVAMQRPIRGEGACAAGWGVTANRPSWDAISTCLSVIALKSARAGGLRTGEALSRAHSAVELIWIVSDGGAYPATISNEDGRLVLEGEEPAAGLVTAAMLGLRREQEFGGAIIERLAERALAVADPSPDQGLKDARRYWLTTLGLFFAGGQYWRKWVGPYSDYLLATRSQTDRSTWPATGEDIGDGPAGIYGTSAYCAWALEVFYRYVPPVPPEER